MEELEAAGVGLNDAEAASGGLVLLLQRLEREGDVGMPEPDLALIGELAAALDHADGIMIDPKALRARIARGLGERGIDEIEAIGVVRQIDALMGIATTPTSTPIPRSCCSCSLSYSGC